MQQTPLVSSVPLLVFLQVYYPVRHALVSHMVSAMQRLGFSGTASLEHRRLAVDLAEVALKWELQRIRDHSHDDNIVCIRQLIKFLILMIEFPRLCASIIQQFEHDRNAYKKKSVECFTNTTTILG